MTFLPYACTRGGWENANGSFLFRAAKERRRAEADTMLHCTVTILTRAVTVLGIAEGNLWHKQ